MKYRKKPVVIQAWPVRDLIRAASTEWKALPESVRAAYEQGVFVFCPDKLFIQTLEGSMEGGIDDWIIQGVKGEFYPCKPDIFAATYEAVNDTPEPQEGRTKLHAAIDSIDAKGE